MCAQKAGWVGNEQHKGSGGGGGCKCTQHADGGCEGECGSEVFVRVLGFLGLWWQLGYLLHFACRKLSKLQMSESTPHQETWWRIKVVYLYRDVYVSLY